MFRDCYLIDECGNDQLLGKGHAPRALRPALGVMLVMPRSQCLYLRLDARGVPLLRLRSFARLQLLAQSPIVQPEAFVARQRDTLHVWLWDGEHARAFARRHGWPLSRVEVLPSSVMTQPPPAVGAAAVLLHTPGSTGCHAQLWRDRRLLHDGWFEAPPNDLSWRIWREDAIRQHGLQWPEAAPVPQDHPILRSPWARNLLRGPRVAAASGRPALTRTALGCATALSVAYGVWLQAQSQHYRGQIDQVQDAESDMSARLRPVQEARESALQSQRWAVEADRLLPRPSATTLLQRIGDAVTAQGAVVRDLEIQDDRVRVTVAAAVGELNLPDLTQTLSRVPGFDDVRFVDAAGAQGLRFSWRLRDRGGSARAERRAEADQP
jgi:hypothetical protein